MNTVQHNIWKSVSGEIFDPLLASLIGNAEDIITIHDTSGRFLFLHAPARYGIQVSKYVKKMPSSLFSKENGSKVLENISRVVKTGKCVSFEIDQAFRARTYWFSVLLFPVKSRTGEIIAVGKICRDITELQNSRHENIESKNLLQALIDGIPESLLLMDRHFSVLTLNKTVGERFGFRENEIVGRKITDFVSHSKLGIIVDSTRKAIRTGKTVRYDNERNGRIYSILVSPIRDRAGMVSKISLLGLDITEQKHLESLLKESMDKLEYQNRLLEDKNAALRELIDQLKGEKQKIEKKIYDNLEQLVFPVLTRLKIQTKNVLLDLVEDNLKNIVSSFGSVVNSSMLKLTAKEINICNMIRNGITTKEISNSMGISKRTVDAHRNNIRKKLKLSKQKINLPTYLKTILSEQE